ncbi:MFS transporter [Micromonospora sp. NPDC048842]|uniref:MFS transporter n=1 Tax=unclassified Micromonospora TaxID=2617518 RepID=UPI0033FB17A9
MVPRFYWPSLALLAFGLAVFAGTWLAPRLTERAGSRTAVALGAVLTAAGYMPTALVHDAAATFVVWQVLIGAGNGVVLATPSTYVVTRAPADAAGISSGLFNTARAVGGALSGATFAAVSWRPCRATCPGSQRR